MTISVRVCVYLSIARPHGAPAHPQGREGKGRDLWNDVDRDSVALATQLLLMPMPMLLLLLLMLPLL